MNSTSAVSKELLPGSGANRSCRFSTPPVPAYQLPGEDGRLLFITATSERVTEIERVQESEQAGPCVQAFTTGNVVTIDKISGIDRWPLYRQTAAQAGFESVVGLPLIVEDRRVGSLNVYDTGPREWSADSLASARVLADIATAYIVRAGELAEAHALSHQLQHALDSRVIIEQAKGMLARDHKISVDAAFDRIRSHSRTNHVPVRTVAEAVVNLGLLIPEPGK